MGPEPLHHGEVAPERADHAAMPEPAHEIGESWGRLAGDPVGCRGRVDQHGRVPVSGPGIAEDHGVDQVVERGNRLELRPGLFEVAPGVHQVRGYDLANMSIIDGKTGWILVDPLTTKETAAAAIAFARKNHQEFSPSL